MSTWMIYSCTAAVMIGAGLLGALARAHAVRRIVAVNVMASGVFLLLVASARRAATPMADPVPHALVLTGIVVSVSGTALALAIARRIGESADRSGEPREEDR